MFSFQDRPVRLCDGQSRREILRAGGLSLLSLGLPTLIRAAESTLQGERGPTFGRAKNVIFLYLAGGPPQHETFDPKPDAPLEIRGEFQPISTNVPGIQVCELLPRTARIADRLAIVRSLATDDNIHSSSGAWVLSGHRYNGTNARKIHPSDWPWFGSVIKRLKPSLALPQLSTVWMPDWNRLNENVRPAGQTGGLLGRLWDPERIMGDPSQKDYRVDGLQLDEHSLQRLLTRQQLAQQLEHGFVQQTAVQEYQGFDHYQQQAIEVLVSGKAVKAFQIDHEPLQLREQYGINQWGQCLVMARRLIEAGVRLVHVQWPRMPGDNAVDNPLWDTHAQNFDRLEDDLCPVFDVGFAALIEDLDQRGLLDETLVVAVGEFGRSPTINNKAGRDHWGNVFSCVLAGAGISGGQVFGASDKHGAYPTEDRVEPGDLVATIYHLLGIDHEHVITGEDGRAIPVTHGSPIEKLLGLQPATAARTTAGGDPALVPPYAERLLNYSDFSHGAIIRSFAGSSRPKGWRAAPIVAANAAGFGLQLVAAETVAAPFQQSHVAMGVFGDRAQAVVVHWGDRALLTQQVRSPFAGSFQLSAAIRASASSADDFQSLFAAHFSCRLFLFEFTDLNKQPDRHRVLESLDFVPTWEPAPTATGEEVASAAAEWQRIELSKTFSPASPGANISFGLGLGVGLSIEKSSRGDMTIASEPQARFACIRIARLQLEFVGKPRNDDVQV